MNTELERLKGEIEGFLKLVSLTNTSLSSRANAVVRPLLSIALELEQENRNLVAFAQGIIACEPEHRLTEGCECIHCQARRLLNQP